MNINATHLYQGATVADLYRSAFRSFRSRNALVSDTMCLTYDELARRVYKTVRYFESAGLRQQDGIAILAANSADAVVTIIAAQFLGLRSTALHPMGSLDDQAFVLRDASIKALVVDASHFAQRGADLADQGIAEHVFTLGPGPFGIDLVNAIADMDDSETPIRVQPDDVSKISYTGGTTGRSKGVLQPQRTVLTMTLLQLAYWEWPEDIRFLAATPISHAAGSCILPVFLRGGVVFFMRKFDSEGFLKAVHTHRITATFLVPTQIYGLLDSPSLDDYDHSSLQTILYGAAPIAPARLKEGLNKFGPVFCQLYGQAEAPMTISYLRKDEHDPDRPHLMSSCGKPMPGLQVTLRDPDGNAVAPDDIGELCVRGPLLMNGYLNRPEDTDEVFKEGWLHTGDMARMDENGYLYLVDRTKDMIISGGFNVYSSEVENCLAQHPAVAVTAVIGIPHPKWGEAVTAIVVLKPDTRVDAPTLIDFVTQHKGRLNAPKRIIFEAEMPLTSVGKIDKKAIRKRYTRHTDTTA